jgi:cytochrome P450
MKPSQTAAHAAIEPASLDVIDLASPEFWALPPAEREGAFQKLRREDPIRKFKEVDYIPGLPVGDGFYAITRHADILEMSRQPELFCSSRGATSINDLPTEMLEFYGSMINMDDPRHGRLRGLVSKSFTPRVMQTLMDDVQRTAVDVLERIKPMGTCDFVTEVSMRLPLKIICQMMGVPESQYDFVLAKSNIILSSGDPEYIPEGSDLIQAFMTAGAELAAMMAEVSASKRQHPGSDLASALVNAELDGERLTDQELASFFILLLAAGNETTRNAITHGLMALSANPDQRDVWMADFEAIAPTAVEEIVRWATPVVFMRRTATRDVTVGGHEFHEGDKCILFYNSANRDERVFADPYEFDVRRDPNFHVGFGGPGPHFCLGAHLARREITVMFRELFARVPQIRITSEPDRLRSGFINGVKHLQVAIG